MYDEVPDDGEGASRMFSFVLGMLLGEITGVLGTLLWQWLSQAVAW